MVNTCPACCISQSTVFDTYWKRWNLAPGAPDLCGLRFCWRIERAALYAEYAPRRHKHEPRAQINRDIRKSVIDFCRDGLEWFTPRRHPRRRLLRGLYCVVCGGLLLLSVYFLLLCVLLLLLIVNFYCVLFCILCYISLLTIGNRCSTIGHSFRLCVYSAAILPAVLILRLCRQICPLCRLQPFPRGIARTRPGRAGGAYFALCGLFRLRGLCWRLCAPWDFIERIAPARRGL